MTIKSCRFVWLLLPGLLAMHSAVSIELKSAVRTPAKSVGARSVESGTVIRIDVQKGSVELDRKRRFVFSPATVAVRKQSNQRGATSLADVKVGAKVSVSLQKTPDMASPRVTEFWIAP